MEAAVAGHDPAGQAPQTIGILRKMSAELSHYLPRPLPQREGTAVVTQSLPEREKSLGLKPREFGEAGNLIHPGQKLRLHPGDLGLLQHDLRDINPVGADLLPPGKDAAAASVVAENRLLKRFNMMSFGGAGVASLKVHNLLEILLFIRRRFEEAAEYPVPLVFLDPLENQVQPVPAPGAADNPAPELQRLPLSRQSEAELEEIPFAEAVFRIPDARAAPAQIDEAGSKAFLLLEAACFEGAPSRVSGSRRASAAA